MWVTGRIKISVLAALMGLLASVPYVFAEETGKEVELWFFWGDGCELCETADAWLDELCAAYPDLLVHRLEVWFRQDERENFIQMMEDRGMTATGVPTFILDEMVWEGFNDLLAGEIDYEVDYLLSIAKNETDEPILNSGRYGSLNLGPLGRVDIGSQPLLAATLLIALVDGFNPCSLWVLTVLLAIILNNQSRLRIAAVGATFLLVTAAVYGLFIAGLYTALAVVDHLAWIRWLVALLALAFAAVNIKDWFAFKRGFSLTIPDRLKPAIHQGGREVARDRPLPVMLVITVVFAAGVALIELPCTAGFPVIWTGLVSDSGVGSGGFVALLAAYLGVYLLIEITFIAAALVTMRAARMQEIHGRTLKLIGGTVMAAIAVVLLVAPRAMERFAVSLWVIGSALAAAVLIMLATRCLQSRKQNHAEKHDWQ